jgi:hypothetical protein
MTELDDLSLATWLESEKGFALVEVRRTAMGREVFLLDGEVTPELLTEYDASSWKRQRESFKPPGHQP